MRSRDGVGGGRSCTGRARRSASSRERDPLPRNPVSSPERKRPPRAINTIPLETGARIIESRPCLVNGERRERTSHRTLSAAARRATIMAAMPGYFTGRGDDGFTEVLGEGRLPKHDPRIEAVGAIDDASAALGLARAMRHDPAIRAILVTVPRHLY